MAFGDFTVARTTVKYVLNASGVLASVAADTPAFEFNADGTYRGLSVEPAGTNGIRNNTNVGAILGVTGSGGALPTNWGGATNGLTREIVALGTENGVDYIDIKLSGTATSTFAQIQFDTATGIVASNGQVWTGSAYFKIISFATPPTSVQFQFDERTVGGTIVTQGQTTIVPTTTLSRFSATRTLSGGGTVERVQLITNFSITSGNTYDFTIRIGLPQMEESAVATSVIKTSGSTVTRTADSVTLTGASSLIGQTEGTIFFHGQGRNAGINRGMVAISDGTNSNRIVLQIGGGDTFEVRVVAGGVTQGAVSAGASDMNANKWAARYSASGVTLYKNGASVGTPLGALTIPAVDNVRLGLIATGTSNQFNGHILALALFPSDIGDASAIALTT
jgi:hypothetical protein